MGKEGGRAKTVLWPRSTYSKAVPAHIPKVTHHYVAGQIPPPPPGWCCGGFLEWGWGRQGEGVFGRLVGQGIHLAIALVKNRRLAQA